MRYMIPLGEVAEFINGAAFKPEDWHENGRKIIRIQNLNDSSKPYNLTTRNVDKKYEVNTGDILVSWSASLGVFEWLEMETAWLNQHIFKAIPDKAKVHKNYFKYSLGKALNDMECYLHGATMKHVNRKEFLSTKIYVPPLEEQRRIAAILDKADGVRRKCKEAIRLTEELLRSTFLEMFGDPVTNPKGWEIVKIENIIELVSGQVDPRESPYSNMLHVGGDNIESGTGEISGCKTPAELSLISGKYLFRKGDILYSKIRPYLNKVSLPDFDGVCSADIYPIRVNHSCVTPIYMTSILRSKGFLEYAEKHSTRTNIPKINRKALLSFECPLPPLGLQNQFTNSANKILKIKDHEKTGVDKANNLFNSLLQRAFRGEL
ncbi:MAG: restriction endonuclease subunit S [Microcystis sp.]|jgi:type I restriction enzyme S subunit